MKPSVPTLLSFNGGYVDTAGFLALQGLFTAHVTGNFVTFGAALAHGATGAIAKLLALPVFCAVVVVTRLIGLRLTAQGRPALKSMMLLKAILLALAAAFAIAWGPFPEGDHWPLLVTGMTLVSAMAIQNAAHRVHLAKAPPTTLMTGASTQIMLDIADLIGRRLTPEERGAIHARLRSMSTAVAAFAAGCGAAALLFVAGGVYVFLAPPVVALLAFLSLQRAPEPAAA